MPDMTKMTVNPGVCGFICLIEAEQAKKYNAAVRVQSQCKQVGRFAEKISEVDFMEIMRAPIGQNKVVQAAAVCKLHPSCVIPTAVIKAVEAELGLALKRDITIKYEE
jgi:hypothetical protein